MEQIGIIFLKANIAIALFTIFYWVVLKRFTFYQINRFYLIFALIFSLLYPFIQISSIQFKQLNAIPEIIPNLIEQSNQLIPDFGWKMILSIWCLGTVYLFYKLTIQLLSLWNIHKFSQQSSYNKSLRLVGGEISPFSFGSFIYINPVLHTKEELEAVMIHETVHVQQKHSFDILLSEILLLLNWINPFVWLLKKSIKENIEYITDHEVLKRGIDKKEYQYFLLNITQQSPILKVQNNFSIADLKKRILQMNMKKTSYSRLTIYILIPIIAIGLLVFGQHDSNKNFNETNIEIVNVLPISNSNNNVKDLDQAVENKNNAYEMMEMPPPPPPRPAVEKKISSIPKENTVKIKGISLDHEKKELVLQLEDQNGKEIEQTQTNDESKIIKLRGVPTDPSKAVVNSSITLNDIQLNTPKVVEDKKDINDPKKEIVVKGFKIQPKED